MNKDKLRNIIELVVRKEVKKQLSEIFINEKEEIKLAETISKPKPKKVINKPKKQYTKNTALNEVLNQIELSSFLILLIAIVDLGICIKDKIPSCILAPPDELKIISTFKEE